MSTEAQIISAIQHLEVSLKTIEHFCSKAKNNVARVNLEYSKKFLYEQWETHRRALEQHRARVDPSSPLSSTIRGGSLTAKQAIDALQNNFC